MKERPILFSPPMVRALLAGRKTQTRRAMKPQPPNGYFVDEAELDDPETQKWLPTVCRYGAPGDRLWVRETVEYAGVDERGYDRAVFAADRASTLLDTWPWKRRVLPAIHMPRGLRRIELDVTAVRVERLHTITEEDARAEGVDTSVVDPSPRGCPDGILPKQYATARDCFADLWRAINGAESWDANPWVWVVTFKRVKPG